VKVRQIKDGEPLGSVIGLLQRFFAEEGFTTPAEKIAGNTKLMARNEACGIFVATEGDIDIGVATVSMELGIEFGWSGEMGDLYVVPEWRGKGVAKALVETVETYLKRRGAGGYQVTVTPHAAEQGLANLYQRLGFASEGRAIYFKVL
jgi:GNAT superfamily N-acetyltransferase